MGEVKPSGLISSSSGGMINNSGIVCKDSPRNTGAHKDGVIIAWTIFAVQKFDKLYK